MKTTTAANKNQLQLCESSNYLPSSLLWWVQSWFTLVRKKLSLQLAHVSQATHAILVVASQAILKAISNYRIYVGILTIFLSEYAAKFYLLFDSSAGAKSDFWNAYFFTYTIREDVAVIFLATGVFILFRDNKLSIATLIPLGYKFTHIIYLALIPTSDFTYANELVRGMPLWSHVVMGFSFSIYWIMLFDYLMTLHYHKIMGTVARLVNIMRAPNIDNDTRLEIATKEAEKYVALISK